MSSSQNVEMEAAKFLHKLIQESKDEPAKLATKLYVILQHMKSSGKEHSMPYQVISRAMETVINQHGLDIEALKLSRLPLTGGNQIGDSASAQFPGSSQAGGVAKDSKVGLAESEVSKVDPYASNRPPVGQSSSGHDYYQGSVAHRSSQSFDHESPSSLDSRSANSQSQERQQRDGKKATTKRKRGDTSLPVEQHDNTQQLDTRNAVVNPRKGKMNKVEPLASLSVKGGERTNFNMVPSSGQMEHFASLSGSMRSMLRTKQEGQHMIEKQLDSANISNSMLRAPNPKYPEEVEVSSASGQQQGGSIPSHDIRGGWNQNKTGLPFEKSQVPRFSSNVVSGNMMAETPAQQSTAPSLGSSAFGKVQGGMAIASGSYPVVESGFSSPMRFSGSLEHEGGSLNMLADANKVVQSGRQSNVSEMSMLRSAAPRDTGKALLPHAPMAPGMPFKEQQLKQLRAQCLVFLAFRNGLLPKKLHLEIALGNIFPKEGGNTDGPRKELSDHKGKAQSLNEPSSSPDVMMPFGRPNTVRETDILPPVASSTGRLMEADTFPREAKSLKMTEDKNGLTFDISVLAEEKKHLLAARKPEAEMQAQEMAASQACLTMVSQQADSLNTRGALAVSNPVEDFENGHLQVGRANQASSVMGRNKQMNPEIISWTGIGGHSEVSRGPILTSSLQRELVPERKDSKPSQFQNLSNSSGPGNQHADSQSSSFTLKEQWKPILGVDNDHHTAIPTKDANVMSKRVSQEQEYEDRSVSTDSPPSPKYTMSEKWLMDQQKNKLLVEQSWVQKQQKTKQRIATCFDKLKENVSSSEDISAKTKSVIELKKLQLLDLQRRLRSDFLNDFFKPITTETDRLKLFKKHRHGRRIKQIEKFEQKMKEERQKRIRERQKEFFSEIEVHKERLDDVFKIKRERWKGFNKYVKEFHKRKERIHREKIDRIQREKINLLKINDVEGYLRMVQDAKSDRVKQLLKETEKYLQKLGSKLQEAKTTAGHFEHDMDEIGTESVIEKSETTVENEDESDQAKHYMESNEKYYLMAHSIKENIAEQPFSLLGGKLREYQMNGLRWLVSLYNNHLNGILADEMGLGKTVQVIALICYLMETKNDRGPFLVVVPSSVLPGWDSEINFWAPSILRIVYAGPPEERRRLYKEKIVHRKFNVLLTTYEYLMNKHDRPKLSKVHWHYIIIDEGHRIKNASCKLNAELKHYQSSHRLLLTGTPLQNNLEELWALLNFLLPNIFNSSEDFSQWFNKPFQSGDNSPDEALLSEEENLLIINRLHQVLRPFVLRRLKHKVENELPEKIERLIRCEASAYQKLLMKRVEDNLGSIGASKARTVHNSVMELRNICNHPYLSHIHAEEVDNLIPMHYLPPVVRLCGKLEMLDRLLPKLKATDHRVLFFSTMTRLLDVMEEYLSGKQYRYLRLDGHTSGGDRGALIDKFNQQGSPYFIFLLSIRAGGVGVNLQAADTVIIFDTDWNPQVDLQAQARAHRIGQKREVLVLRFETVQTVEEQVRAAAEHKLGVANQSITAGFFDNNTSAEDRREYLESLLRESKKEEAAPVLDDDALNDLIARSESEIDVFESVDKQRQEIEMATWKKLLLEQGMDVLDPVLPLPSRLVTDDDLKKFYEAMKIFEVPRAGMVSNVGVKRKGDLGGLDAQHYGRGKRAREVRSYEEQWTEEEFEKICQVDSPESPKPKEEVIESTLPTDAGRSMGAVVKTELPAPIPLPPPPPSVEPPPLQQSKEITPPSRRGRGRPKRATSDKLPASTVPLASPGPAKVTNITSGPDSINVKVSSDTMHHTGAGIAPSSQPAIILPSVTPGSELTVASPSVSIEVKGQGRKTQSGVEAPRRRGKKQGLVSHAVPGLVAPDPKLNEQGQSKPMNPSGSEAIAMSGSISDIPTAHTPDSLPGSAALKSITGTDQHSGVGNALNSQSTHPFPSVSPVSQSTPPCPSVPMEIKGQSRKTQSGVGAPRRRGRKPATASLAVPNVLAGQNLKPSTNSLDKSGDSEQSKKENNAQQMTNIVQEQACHAPDGVPGQGTTTELSDDLAQSKQITSPSTIQESAARSSGAALGQCQNTDVCEKQSVAMEVSSENVSLNKKISELPRSEGGVVPCVPVLSPTVIEVIKNHSSEDGSHPIVSSSNAATPVFGRPADSFPASPTMEGVSKTLPNVTTKIAPSSQSAPSYSSVAPVSQSLPPCPSEPMQVKRQGRKTPARVEAPRRRGRKQAPVVPAVPDDLAGQDPKSSLQSQNRSGDSLGTKAIPLRSKQGTDSQELMNVIQAQACEVQSPGGLAGHDPKRKERSANAAQNKQTKLDIGAGTSDKTPLLGRIQTADVNDVARVMKEVFSGTVPAKARIVESFGSEGRDASKLTASSKILVEMAKIQSPEDKACSALPTVETAAQAFVERQPETKADAKVEDANAPVMSETLVPLTNEGKLQSNSVAGTVEKIEDSGQLSNENSSTPSIMESICASPLTAGEKDVDHCQRAPQDGDLAGFIRGASSDQVDSSLACPGEVEPTVGINDNSGNKSKSSLKESPSSSHVDPSSLVYPTISTRTNDAGDNPGTTSSVPTNPDDPDMVKSPGMTESGSGNKTEAFVIVPVRSSNEFNSLEGLRVSTKSDDVGDHLRVTSHIPATSDHSGSEVAPDVAETESNSGKKTECAEKESSDIYNFSSSVSDKLDMASAEAKATNCSSGAVAEGLETSQKDIDLVAVLDPADIEIPSDKGQWDAQHGSSKAQGEPRLETVRSVVPESTNAELFPKDHVGPLPPEMPSPGGDCVGVCNMEVDPSEKDPVSSTVPVEVLECPEAEMSDGIDAPQVGGVLPDENMSENTDPPLSCIVREEKEVDASNMGPVGSSVTLEDSKRSDAETDDQKNVTQICGIVPENISKDMDLPQCPSAIEGENIDDLSEKGPVGSIVAIQGSKSSKSEIDDQTDASQVHKLVADDASEKVGLPVCSSATESENVEGSSEKSAVDSSEAVNESKGSEAEEDNRIDVSQDSLLMPKSISKAVVRPSSSLAKEDKKIKDLLDKGPVTSSVPWEETKGSEVEMDDQMDALQTGLIAPENTVLEHMNLPSSSLGTEEEETEVFLEKGPVSSLARLEDSICSEAEMGDRINVSQVGGILPLENKSENIDMPSSSIVIEKRIEDSDVGQLAVGSSVAVEESKGYKAEMDDGMTVSQVPGNASENMDLPQSSSATEGENIEGLSEKALVGSLVAVEESNDQMIVSHDCGVVREENISEDIHMPLSSIGTEKEKVDDSSVREENISEDIQMPSSSIGTEKEKVEDSPVREENISEDIHMPSSSIGIEEEKVEDSLVREENISEDIHMPSSSIGTEEEKVGESEEKVEDSPVREENISEDIHMPSFSIGTEEEKVEDSSVREENISEDIHMPSSSIGTEKEKVEDSSVREENISEDIHMPSSSIGTEEEKVQDSVREEKISEDIHMPSSSIGTEEEKVGNSSVREKNISEDIHMPSFSIGTEEEKVEDSSVREENLSEDIHLPSYDIATEEEKVEHSSNIASSVSLEESKGSEDQACGNVPENVSKTLDLPECPSATEGGNIEGVSEKGPIDSLAAMEESNGSKPEISDQIDASQISGFKIVPDNASENRGLPVCSSVTESENVEDSSEKGPVASSEAVDELKGSQAERV